MERVKKGEKYWHIGQWGDILMDYEGGSPIDDWLFQYGNYFATEEQAESMSKKLRAVLNGADVIEMPSEEEMHSIEVKDIVLLEFFKESHEDLDMIMHGRHAYWKGWNAAIRWLKEQLTKED